MYKQASISFNHLNTLIHLFRYSNKAYRNEQIAQCNTKYGEEKHESS
jgi:hypothetical protein